jgi:TfoX/Sxy family transcriptional regulator of competence genes
MASEMEFIEYVVTQMEDLGNVRYRKMFGDCMIYLNERPVILVCDNTTYVKKHPAIEELVRESETGIPYEGAKEYYIIDAGHKKHFTQVLSILEEVLPLPKKRPKQVKKIISPCGAVCKECKSYPKECGGCAKIKGKVFWLEYVGADICPIYQCCKDKGEKHCGNCPKLPCEKFMKDPNFSEEENEANLKKMIKNLKYAL